MTDQKSVNRLAKERSPYLLQHAHNPVDWFPWCSEAFEKAKNEDKPIFLSIGYSACHWCHVMERESFEDERTAKLLNESFVSIKVDREERPDVDQVYQLAHQVLSRRGGGWPLSVFLTPAQQPFYGGTYFPPERRYGMPSFREVLAAVLDAWSNRRTEITEQAEELSDFLGELTSVSANEAPLGAPSQVLSRALAVIMPKAERNFGGFGRAPKFPNTMTLDLLLLAGTVLPNEDAHVHALCTLERMARGGMYDHLAGGFARYSTDERWLIPHFEKMLYDNAQLLRLYLDGWRAQGKHTSSPRAISQSKCETVVRETASYLLREMTDPAEGCFYSAQDADSEGEEGRFFSWTPEELTSLLGEETATLLAQWFGVTREGNFEHGRSVLWNPYEFSQFLTEHALEEIAFRNTLAQAREKLFLAREQRPKPMRDEKALVGWNALVCGALADAGATWNEPRWTQAAVRALTAWRTHAWKENKLAHAAKDGVTYGTGFLDDYAGLGNASLDVYEATFAPEWLAFANALTDAMLQYFWDETHGGLFYTPSHGEKILVRSKDPHDHAYPGGVGLAAELLLRIAEITGKTLYRERAEQLLLPLLSAAAENPMGMATVTRAVDRLHRGSTTVVITGVSSDESTQAMLSAARSVLVPHRVLLCGQNEEQARSHGIAPEWFHGRDIFSGKTTGWICRGTRCLAPVHSPEALREALEGLWKS